MKALMRLKVHKFEDENQIGRKIKSHKSDRSGK